MAGEGLFGDMVRRARLANRIGPHKLARRIGISRSDLRAIEANRRVPSAEQVREVGRALGLKPDDVLSAAGILDDPERYLRRNPYASVLSRRVSEGRLDCDQIRRLSDAADRLERRQIWGPARRGSVSG